MSESVPGAGKRRLARGAYLLPSLFTIGNMLLGFYAVVTAFRGSKLVPFPEAEVYFDRAVLAVFFAALLDTLDGRIARMTGTDSDFGKEYDSLADLFTFGAVPALLAFLWGLHEFGRIGWLVPLYYMVCTATRLARFNVQVKTVDSRYFVGLPSPAAAGAVCFMLFYRPENDWFDWWSTALFVVLGVIGTLEVSTFRYWSTKQVDFRRRWSYRAALPLAVVIFLIAWKHQPTLLAIALVYAVSGPLLWVIGRFGRRSHGHHGDAAEAAPSASEATSGEAPAPPPVPPEPPPPNDSRRSE